ncbi:U-scoloptoxin(01)-Er1a-like [Montipora capricornis]|uniref:U-scoloptoxin(01)-Er1a-like n=1 Tax=Montipora capricornis TaxID=246305 RepID=UPI0035F1FB7D
MQTPFLLITSFLLFCPGILAGVLQDGPSDFCANKNPGNHPDPDTCSGFIMCDVAGRMHKMTCPSNLLFNPTLLVCDWPSNVDCDDGSGATAGF